MKAYFFAASLLLGTAAVAQMTPPATDPGAPPPAGESMTPPVADPVMPPAPAEPMDPAASPSAIPAPPMAPMASNPPPPAPAEYPRCSRTITDQCIQNSARESDTRGGSKRKPRRG